MEKTTRLALLNKIFVLQRLSVFEWRKKKIWVCNWSIRNPRKQIKFQFLLSIVKQFLDIADNSPWAIAWKSDHANHVGSSNFAWLSLSHPRKSRLIFNTPKIFLDLNDATTMMLF